ncbi:hypothetical protein ILUMI_08039 [Ignelater luminosus]|uniref:Uncharacterized protein n=1 Tax=Ignelater luminosus TaxID=2038154 RepID=A0A8K0GGA8_IGNLU|nr:hypothetical protein ILUMI_08039 [Ignelater luminosus]
MPRNYKQTSTARAGHKRTSKRLACHKQRFVAIIACSRRPFGVNTTEELFLPSEITENDIEKNEEQMNIAGVLKKIAQNVKESPSSPTILTGHGDIQTLSQTSSDQPPSLEGHSDIQNLCEQILLEK